MTAFLTDPTLAFGLNGVSDFSPERPFINRMKQARMWETTGKVGGECHIGFFINGGYTDENLYITSMPPDITSFFCYLSGTLEVGSYVFKFTGTSTVVLSGAGLTVTSGAGTNRIAFNVTAEGTHTIRVTAIPNPADYPRDMVLVRTDHEELQKLGEVWNPDFLASVGPVRQVRFMDWMNTNFPRGTEWTDGSPYSVDGGSFVGWYLGSRYICYRAHTASSDNKPGSGPNWQQYWIKHNLNETWAERQPVTSYSYTEDFGRGNISIPVEIMVALCNKIGANPWFNMPPMADDDYITQFATYVKANLNAGLVASVEWGNEMWNFATAFGQNNWAGEKGKVTWGKTVTISIAPLAVINMPGHGLLANAQIGFTSSGRLPIDKRSSVTISNASPGVVTWFGHGLAVDTPIVFTTSGSLPTGLTASVTYYVKNVLNANTFTVAATVGGAEINTSSAGSGSHTATSGISRYTGYYVKTVLDADNFTVSLTSGGGVIDTTTGTQSGVHTCYKFTAGGISPDPQDWAAVRCTQAAKIWVDIFSGADRTRLQTVFCTRYGDTFWLTRMFTRVAWNFYGNPSPILNPADYFDAVETATYFGGSTVNVAAEGLALLNAIATMSAQAAREWYRDQMIYSVSVRDSVANCVTAWTAVKNLATSYGVKFVAYEGGSHMDHNAYDGSLTTQQKADLTAFIRDFHDRPEMADVYIAQWNAWKALGAGPFMQFVDFSTPSSNSWFGMLPSPLAPSTPTSEALFALNAQQGAWFGAGGGTQYTQQVVKAIPDAGAVVPVGPRGSTITNGAGKSAVRLPGVLSDYTVVRDPTDTALYSFTHKTTAAVHKQRGVQAVAFGSV